MSKNDNRDFYDRELISIVQANLTWSLIYRFEETLEPTPNEFYSQSHQCKDQLAFVWPSKLSHGNL